MRTHLLIFVALALFSLAPPAFAGSVPAGGQCPNGISDCVTGLACISGVCQNLSPTPGNPGVRLINPLSSGNCNSANTDCLGAFLEKILDFVIRIGSIVVILMMVFVGFKFVTAQGNESKIGEAKNMLLWTVIGALVLLGAKAIAIAIKATVQSLGG